MFGFGNSAASISAGNPMNISGRSLVEPIKVC